MKFLSPWFLFGAAAIAGPIIFHLIRRAARQRTQFSSIMFLSPTPPRAVRRRKLEHILLLLLRCLCLLLLAFGFARPFFAHDITPPSTGQQERRLILLIDTSASMWRQGIENQARAVAGKYLDKSTPSDQVAVMAFDSGPRTLVSFAEWSAWPQQERVSLARQRLAAVIPSCKETQLGLALTGAAEQFRENAEANREIILITDLQEGAKFDGLQGYQWPPGTRVRVERVEAKPASNAGLEILEPPTSFTGADDSIRVRVANSSDSRNAKFNLHWPNRDGPDIYLPPGQTRVFTAPRPPTGMQGGELSLGGADPSPGSTSYYAAPEMQQAAIYCAGLGASNDPDKMFYYFQRALPSTPRWKARFLSDFSDKAAFAIIAADMNPEQMPAFKAWVESGKTALLILTAKHDSAAILNNWVPVEMTEAGGDYALLGSIDFQHPIFKPFDDPRFSDFTHIHIWKHRRWNVPASATVRVLARFDDDSPALVELQAGRGRLLVLASGWDPADSQLAVSSKFVPLLQTILAWAGVGAPMRTQYHTGDIIPSPFSSGDTVAWFSTDKRITNLPPGEAFTLTDWPGLYTAEQSNQLHLFGVNVPLDESRVAPISQDELARLGVPIGPENEPNAAKVKMLQQRLQDAELENRQKLWRWLIVAALAVTFGEVVLSGWLARRVEKTEALS